mmetsp:Transcript_18646/g.46154  ORF Transcript_18646/g.46154 Transcript_18646/m.46154 type:complete len:105 (-) Transcript_18646:523-837(-)
MEMPTATPSFTLAPENMTSLLDRKNMTFSLLAPNKNMTSNLDVKNMTYSMGPNNTTCTLDSKNMTTHFLDPKNTISLYNATPTSSEESTPILAFLLDDLSLEAV